MCDLFGKQIFSNLTLNAHNRVSSFANNVELTSIDELLLLINNTLAIRAIHTEQ